MRILDWIVFDIESLRRLAVAKPPYDLLTYNLKTWRSIMHSHAECVRMIKIIEVHTYLIKV